MKRFYTTLAAVLFTAQLCFAQFGIPGTGVTAQWAKIGTFTAPQGGGTVRIIAYIHLGYNASNSQDAVYTLTFKTSNGSSTDSNGFAGNGSWYSTGLNGAIGPGGIKWKANAAGPYASAYDLYIYLPVFTEGSQYEVSAAPGTSWTNVGSLGQTDPGSASASVLIPDTYLVMPYGNVGIGTSTPDATLAVNGTIHSKVVKVDLSGWPDYVFKPTYALPTLKSVKSYVDRNGHLPDMPSEQEVAKSGLNLGEMNALLTKKVEELTLYLIEKDNQLKAQEAINRKQEDRLKKIETQLSSLTKNQ